MTWKCPKCGREFRRQNQEHYCLKPKTVDEYITMQPEGIQPVLREIRAILRQAMPQAEERIAWSMPTYRRETNLIHFTAAKKHVSLFPGEEAVQAFSDKLAAYSVEKGTVRLPYDKPLPVELIAEIAAWCYEKQTV